MGYRSDVRIITSKKGFKELNKYVKNYLKDSSESDYNLMDNLKFKAENDYACYFGWNYLKWYEGYGSVDAIINGLEHLKEKDMSYRISRIGESYDDIEEEYYESEKEEEQDLEFPSMLRQFDDEYTISMMDKSNPVKKHEYEEL